MLSLVEDEPVQRRATGDHPEYERRQAAWQDGRAMVMQIDRVKAIEQPGERLKVAPESTGIVQAVLSRVQGWLQQRLTGPLDIPINPAKDLSGAYQDERGRLYHARPQAVQAAVTWASVSLPLNKRWVCTRSYFIGWQAFDQGKPCTFVSNRLRKEEWEEDRVQAAHDGWSAAMDYRRGEGLPELFTAFCGCERSLKAE